MRLLSFRVNFYLAELRTNEKIKQMESLDDDDEKRNSIMASIVDISMSGPDPVSKEELYAVLTEMLGAGVDSVS